MQLCTSDGGHTLMAAHAHRTPIRDLFISHFVSRTSNITILTFTPGLPTASGTDGVQPLALGHQVGRPEAPRAFVCMFVHLYTCMLTWRSVYTIFIGHGQWSVGVFVVQRAHGHWSVEMVNVVDCVSDDNFAIGMPSESFWGDACVLSVVCVQRVWSCARPLSFVRGKKTTPISDDGIYLHGHQVSEL